MKKIFLSIIALCGTLFVSSCVDLDRYPLEERSDASFWKSEEDATQAVSNLYNSLPTSTAGLVDDAINSDDAVHGIKWAAGNISKGIYDPNDQSWDWHYTFIRRANLVMERTEQLQELTPASKAILQGQARFFRAYHYWKLIRKFGDVPYYERTLSLDEQQSVVRAPRQEVYDHVMTDLDAAIKALPKEWTGADYGRITKGMALSVKAQAALYYGKWQEAANAAKAVMDLGVYALEQYDNPADYAKLFWEVSDGSKEFILFKELKANDFDDYTIGWETFPTVGWGGINPTQSLVDAFEDIQGAPISKSTIYDETNPFANRDPRLEVCVLHDGETMYGRTIKVAPLKSCYPTGIAQHGDATATGYYQHKWLDPSIDPQSTGWNMGKDVVEIRYAETLLTYAEAMCELGQLNEALGAVNQVRARVKMPLLQMTDASLPTYCANQADLRERIRNEWRVEFALEGGKRMWDVRRWGIAETVLNEAYLGLKYKLVDSPEAKEGDNGKVCILYQGENYIASPKTVRYRPHNYVFPVPQSEIDINKKLTQNPKY